MKILTIAESRQCDDIEKLREAYRALTVLHAIAAEALAQAKIDDVTIPPDRNLMPGTVYLCPHCKATGEVSAGRAAFRHFADCAHTARRFVLAHPASAEAVAYRRATARPRIEGEPDVQKYR